MTTALPPSQTDAQALAIAQAVQAAVAPATVILFGSRAVGDYRPDSDVDLLVVTDEANPKDTAFRAKKAAAAFMRHCPPDLEVNPMGISRREFRRCRQSFQHLAGQAARYGVFMSDPEMDTGAESAADAAADPYPAHWPGTKQRIRNALRYRRDMDAFIRSEGVSQESIGFVAQQAVENVLKGWLSAYNDDRRYQHPLPPLWRAIQELEDFNDPAHQEVYAAVSELFAFIGYDEILPLSEQADWLSNYAVLYRYNETDHDMIAAEFAELTGLIRWAVEEVIAHIFRISGVDPDDPQALAR